jgi:type I restriction enzyme S subunit
LKEENNSLPEGWFLTVLGKVATWGSGGTPSRSKPSYYNGNIPWVKTGELKNTIVSKTSETITEEGLANSSAKLFPKGSIVIAMYGATIGRTSILGMDAATNQACAVANPYEGLLINVYLYYYLKSQKNTFINQGKGGAQKNISQTVIKKHPLPLPPLAEQKRIVAKLDTSMGHVERSKERLAKVPALLKAFRQSVLAQAVSGQLTADWREAHPDVEGADVLLERLYTFRLEALTNKKHKKELLKSYEEKTVELIYSIPDTWQFVHLDVLCNGFKYGSSKKSLVEGDVPVLRMGNMQGGKIDWSKLKYSSNSVEISKYALEKNDVLFNRTNSPELVGKTAIYKAERPALYAGYLIKIDHYKEFLDSDYLNFSLNSVHAKKWANEVKLDGVSQSNINAQKLAKFAISLPPLQEQKEIVKRVEALFAKADALEAHYNKALQHLETLPQALLAKAFRGELVEQDPNDEPARVLLERIEAEQAALAAAKKKKGRSAKKKQ